MRILQKILLSFLFSSIALAKIPQQEIVSPALGDSLRPRSHSKLELATFLEIPTHTILISTDLGQSNMGAVKQRVQWNPTMAPNLGIRASYDMWSLYLKKRFSLLSDKDAQIYGRSEYDDYRISLQATQYISADVYYQNYRGFYTDLSGQEGLKTSFGNGNSASTAIPAGPTQIVSRPDMQAMNYGARITGILPLSDLLLSSSLAWKLNVLGKAYYNRQSIVGDGAIVPEARAGTLSPIASLKEYWANTLGVGAGLGCDFPMTESFALGFDAMLGVGFQRQSQVFLDREAIAYTTAKELNTNFFMNWKYPDHGYRLSFYADSFMTDVEGVHLDTTSLGFTFMFSYSGFSL